MYVCTAVDNVLQRMTIVGVLLSFRCLAQEALLDVSTHSVFSVYTLYNNLISSVLDVSLTVNMCINYVCMSVSA